VTGPERPSQFARGYPFPTVVDTQGVLGRLLDFDVVPNGVLLDGDGHIAFVHIGGFDVRRDDVRARVEGLLDELAARRPSGTAPSLPQRSIEVEALLAEIGAAPKDAELWTALAEAHARAGDDHAALATYQQAITLGPDRSAAHFGRGSTLARLGRHTEAVDAWKQALSLDPANYVIRKQIWAHRHPEKFWPEIDLTWQQEEQARERAGASDLPPVPAPAPASAPTRAPAPVPAATRAS
jgi:tetratricopeptide (TPR) repeat protein